MTTNYHEPELAILEGINEAQKGGIRITQRELASRAGMSLGMTNALLRQFAERGWVKLTKLSTRSVVYALTPDGIAEIARRTAGFFQRATRNTELYRGRLEAFIESARESGGLYPRARRFERPGIPPGVPLRSARARVREKSRPRTGLRARAKAWRSPSIGRWRISPSSGDIAPGLRYSYERYGSLEYLS